jgi:hypothetical protein
MKILHLLAAAIFTGILTAGEIKLPELVHKGRTYKNAIITKADEATAKISHADGISRIPIADLPESVRTGLGYNPAASAQSKADAEKLAAAEKSLLACPIIRFKVTYNMPQGLLVETMKITDDSYVPTVSSSLSRVGGGGGGPSRPVPKTYRWVGTGTEAFIVTGDLVASIPKGEEFTARVSEIGIYHTADGDVVKRYKVARIEPNQPAKKP